MTGLDARELDRRITILRATKGDDGFSSVPCDHVPLSTLWAGRKDVADSERVSAEAQGQTITSRFIVRWSPLTSTLQPADRLECEGTIFEIVGTKEARGRRIGIEITAKALRA